MSVVVTNFAELDPKFKTVTDAIEKLDENQALRHEDLNDAVAAAIDAYAAELRACCEADTARADLDRAFRETEVTVTCPDVTDSNGTVIPGASVTTSAAGAQYLAAQAQANALQAQTTAWRELETERYTAELERQERLDAEAEVRAKKYDISRLLYLAQGVLQLIATIKQIELFNEYMRKINRITDMVEAQITDLRGIQAGIVTPQLNAHANDLMDGNAARVALLDEKLGWSCTFRDSVLECFNNNVLPMWETLPGELAASASASLTSFNASAAKMDALAAKFEAEYDGVYKPAAAALVPDFQARILELTSRLKEQSDWLFDCAKELNNKYKAAYAGEGAMVGSALAIGSAMADKIPETEAWLHEHALALKAIYESTYKAGEATFVGEVFTTGADLVSKMKAVETWQSEHTRDLEGNYDAYRAGEAALATDVLACAKDLALKAKVAEEWLEASAKQAHKYFDDEYKAGEAELAGVIHTVSTLLAPLAEDINDWFSSVSDDQLACFDDVYKDKEKALTCAVMECATELAPKMVEAEAWFTAHADKQRDHWETAYEAKEVALVCELLDRARSDVAEAHTNLTSLVENRERFIDKYLSTYEAAECDTMPDIIKIGGDAQKGHKEKWEWACDKMEHEFDTHMQNWEPCDIDNLMKHCSHWQENNPLTEVHNNSDEMRELGKKTLDAYCEDGLPCEVKYVGEVCGMPVYEPDFCDLEDRAVRGVEAQFAKARARLERTGARYCHGVKMQQLVELEAAMAKAKSAALLAANRFEQWWQVQEDDRRHRYHMDIMRNIVDRWPDRSLSGFSKSTEGQRAILASMHDAIVRGYTYLQYSHNFGQSALAAMGNALEGSLSATRLGHFWPEAYLSAAQQLEVGYDATRREGIDTVRIGQQWMDLANRSEADRASAIDSKLNRGMQSIDKGHAHVQYAQRAQEARWSVVSGQQGIGQKTTDQGQFWWDQGLVAERMRDEVIAGGRAAGLDMTRIGHDWMAFATSSEAERQRTMATAGQLGVQSLPIGQRYLAMATDTEAQRAQALNAAEQNGLTAVGHGHNLAELAARKGEAAFSISMRAMSEGNQLVRTGLDMARLAPNAYSDSMQQAMNSVGKGIDMATRGLHKLEIAERANSNAMQQARASIQGAMEEMRLLYQTTAGAINQGASGPLQNMSNITNTLGEGVGSGLQGAFSSFGQAAQPYNLRPTYYGSAPTGMANSNWRTAPSVNQASIPTGTSYHKSTLGN